MELVLDGTETVTGRKARGLQTEEIGCKCQTFFICLKLQEETNFKCQVFFPFLYKFKSACSAGDLGSILGWEDPLEKEMATLQYPCLENLMDRGVWWAAVHGVTELDTTERLTHIQI